MYQSYHPINSEKFDKKQRLPPTFQDTANLVLLSCSLFLKKLFGMEAPHKWGMDAVRAGLLNMSDQEKNLGSDCLAHVFSGVLDDRCRHFSNPLSTEASQARYMDSESVRLLVTRMGHMA